MTTETTSLPTTMATPLIPIGKIVSGKNPRKHFEKGQLQELADSIKAKGVLQPILVRPVGDTFEIVAGERRWRAAKLAGLVAVPAIPREMSDDEVLEVALIENLQRSDLHPLEEAEGYHQLQRAGYDVARIAERTGHSVKYVYDRVKLLSLTKDAKKAFADGRFTAGHAILLARLKPADQARAMDEDEQALWQDEYSLFDPEEDERRYAGTRYAKDVPPVKPRSVRELQAWIDKHVRLEATDVDPMLFPETALKLQEAAETDVKVVRITYLIQTPEELKDGPRVVLGRSWKRADGKRGSKACEHSVLGQVVIGPHRGETFPVCVAKKKCRVHWGDLIRAAKKREREVTKKASTGEDREALRRRKQEQEEARRQAEAARWRKAVPAVADALALAISEAPAGAGDICGRLVLAFFRDQGMDDPDALVSPGKTAEDLVRHLAFASLTFDLEYSGPDEIAADARALGVDVEKILNEVAPPPTDDRPKPKKKAAKKGRGK